MCECSRRRSRFHVLGWLGLTRFLAPAARLLSLATLAVLMTLAGAAPAMAADCPDADGDDFVVCGGCEVPAGKACGDCNDNNAAVRPGAVEVCNAIDDNCDGTIDLPDTDPVNGLDDDLDGLIDEGIYFCVYQTDGPGGAGGLCVTGGRAICQLPRGVPAPPPSGQPDQLLTCAPRGAPLVWANETVAAGNCQDGIDNDCDTTTDINDADCVQAEICDGIDNDGDGQVDEGFLFQGLAVGQTCSQGIGECRKTGNVVCDGPNAARCGASPGNPKSEGAQFGQTCGNGKDDDCDGAADLEDSACEGFGAAELCNGADDDGDGAIDEGFPNKGLPCTEGLGACLRSGVFQCSDGGSGTVCSVSAGSRGDESPKSGTCGDFLDNDCDGFTDAADVDCGGAFADLGVTCSLPYHSGGNGNDCNGKHRLEFDGGQATEVQADLLALSPEGELLGILEDVHYGEEAQLASRDQVQVNFNKKTNKYKVHAPVPLLRVTGRKGSVEDVAYCGILPYLEINQPKGVTVSLSESSDQKVQAYLPLANVDTLRIQLDGINVLAALGINPVTAFPTLPPTQGPTTGGFLCTTPGSCVLQVPAGCGDRGLVPVEISNLKVEGLDTVIVKDARDGVWEPHQVNTVQFTVKGLPAGGHIFHISAMPLPLPRRLAHACHVDELDDTGTISAFGIEIDKPVNQEIVASAPVQVQGTVCSGNPVSRLRINGGDVNVAIPANQTCTTGDGVTSANECVVNFNEFIRQKNLADAAVGNAVNATYKRGGNRVVADASDDQGHRTFNTDVVFGLGNVQDNAALAIQDDAAAMMASLPRNSGLDEVVNDIQTMMVTEIDPAFVVGLEEAAAQKFFNEKCQGAIDQFTSRAQTALSGKTFATFDVQPDCSCDLNNVPVVLESLTFTPTAANPACAVDFQAGRIAVTVNLPSMRVQVGAHRSCTDHGLFGECIARTKVNVTAITRVQNISFAFTITETQIETQTPPNKDDFFFTWDLLDPNGNSAILQVGQCANLPQRECYGNKKKDPGAGTSSQCDGGVCNGFVPNPAFDPAKGPGTQKDVGIECWGADLCSFFEAVAAVLVTIFTFGLVDGFDLIGFLEFDFNVNPDFLDELKAAEPDAMGLNEVEVDEGEVSQAGFASFTLGDIDVTIQDGGLTMAVPGTFNTTQIDPTVPVTPPAASTPASAPTVGQLIPTTSDVSMLVADDVFNRIFKAMQEAGKLKACSNADALTVDKLLPPASAGGCDGIGPDNLVGAALQGICHAIRGADEEACLTLPALDTTGRTNTKRGACVGFVGGDCGVFNPGTAGRIACNATPQRDIQASDSVLICARQDMSPDLTIAQSSGTATTVQTNLFLEDLNVVFTLDRGNDGYNGTLEALPGCWGQTGDGAPDCRIYAACADLTVKTAMGIDSSQCAPNQAGFVFALVDVIPESLDLGAICSAGTDTEDQSLLEEAVKSLVTKAVSDNTEVFMPPICVDGLDLNGVLNFNSPDARLFGFTTNGGTGFADFLGITVNLTTSP